MKKIVIFIAILAAGVFSPAFAGRASAQEVVLQHDDGLPAGTVQGLQAGDIETVAFRAQHPAWLLSIRLHFGAVGAPADVFIWADNGGNAPDLNRVLFSTTVLPEKDSGRKSMCPPRMCTWTRWQCFT